MVATTQPVFIAGSGRSNTRTLFRMLTDASGGEAHHEYAVLEVQQLACYAMGLVDKDEAKRQLAQWHGATVHWIDSSNNETLSPKFAAIPHADVSIVSMPLGGMSPLLPLETLRTDMAGALNPASVAERTDG